MAFTHGCSAEVGGFCENYGDISAWNAVVIGLSTNKVDTVRRFGEKLGTPFPMGSDTKGKIRKLYDAERLFGLITSRITYVIDGDGVIRGAFHSEFMVSSHIQNALQTLESIA